MHRSLEWTSSHCRIVRLLLTERLPMLTAGSTGHACKELDLGWREGCMERSWGQHFAGALAHNRYAHLHNIILQNFTGANTDTSRQVAIKHLSIV